MHRLLAVLLLGSLVVAACGDDDTATDPVDDVTDGGADDEAQDGAVADDEHSDASAPADEVAPDEDEPGVPDDQPAAEADDPGAPEDGADPFVFVADLTGDTEVPGPGDPGATGRVEIESTADGELCFDMEVTGLDSDVAAAHIHEGAAGDSGGVVIGIGTPTSSDGDVDVWDDVCVAVDDALLAEIAAEPGDFYANVHSETFGAGAVRGQLETATIFDLTLS